MYAQPNPPFSHPTSPIPNFPQLKDRTRRVKDARTEAQREIDDYRQQKDDEFKKFEKEVRKLRFLTRVSIKGGIYWLIPTIPSTRAATRRPKRMQAGTPRSS